MMNLVIPKAQLAGAQPIPPQEMAEIIRKAKEDRERIAKALKDGTRLSISHSGRTGQPGGINIPDGANKLAGAQQPSPQDMAEIIRKAKEDRERIAKALKDGTRLSISHTGRTGQQGGINIPDGANKLAVVEQWYRKDPSLLVQEKAAMKNAFPYFELITLDDGCLAWEGTLTPGIWRGIDPVKEDEDELMARQTWEVMAVYQNNHPHQQMGSSVKVYLLYPSINIVESLMGVKPHHLLYDNSRDMYYLCTGRAEDVKVGETYTSAATVLAWAVRWLTAFELVMTGDLSKEDFNTPGRI